MNWELGWYIIPLLSCMVSYRQYTSVIMDYLSPVYQYFQAMTLRKNNFILQKNASWISVKILLECTVSIYRL